MKKLTLTKGMKEVLCNSKIDFEEISIVKKGYDYITILKDNKLFDIRY